SAPGTLSPCGRGFGVRGSRSDERRAQRSSETIANCHCQPAPLPGSINSMRSIETTAIVSADRKITITLPFDITPGAHRVVVVIEEATAEVQAGPQAVRATPTVARASRGPLVAHTHLADVARAEYSFRREELYDDVKY